MKPPPKRIDLNNVNVAHVAAQLILYESLPPEQVKKMVKEGRLMAPSDLLSITTAIVMAHSEGSAIVLGKEFTGAIFMTVAGDLGRPDDAVLADVGRLLASGTMALNAGAITVTRPTPDHN